MATQSALLSSLRELLEEEPYHKITIAQIAGRAGVAPASFYSRFADKEALFLELLSRHESEREETLSPLLAEYAWRGQSLKERANGLALVMCDHFRSRRGLLRAYVEHFRANREQYTASQRAQSLSIHRRLEMVLEGAPEAPDREDVKFTVACLLAALRDLVLFDGDPHSHEIARGEDLAEQLGEMAYLYLSRGKR